MGGRTALGWKDRNGAVGIAQRRRPFQGGYEAVLTDHA